MTPALRFSLPLCGLAAALAGCSAGSSGALPDALDRDAALDASPRDEAPAARDDARDEALDDALDEPGDARAPVDPRDAGAPDSGRLGPPYPIVLHHGFAGWRDIGPLNYFYNVARDLRAQGEVVYESAVAPFEGSPLRARMLAPLVDRALAETGRARVVLIAHSQGGLDARHLISQLGYGDRVALLVTVSTPHRGTRVADAIDGAVPGGDLLFNAFATLLGVSYNEARSRADLRASLASLSARAAEQFNRENPDDPRVRYWSWAGRSNLRDGRAQCGDARIANEPSRRDPVNPLLYPFALYLERGDGSAHVNDGLVEVSSARWGEFLGCVPADHFEEIGQVALSGENLAGFDHRRFYRDTVAFVRGAGY